MECTESTSTLNGHVTHPGKFWWIRTTKKTMEDPHFKSSGIQLPVRAHIIGVVLVFNFIVIIFTEVNIWCLDLLEKKWYETGKKLTREQNNEHILQHCTRDLVIHILQVHQPACDYARDGDGELCKWFQPITDTINNCVSWIYFLQCYYRSCIGDCWFLYLCLLTAVREHQTKFHRKSRSWYYCIIWKKVHSLNLLNINK